jgi:hypothetical protein
METVDNAWLQTARDLHNREAEVTAMKLFLTAGLLAVMGLSSGNASAADPFEATITCDDDAKQVEYTKITLLFGPPPPPGTVTSTTTLTYRGQDLVETVERAGQPAPKTKIKLTTDASTEHVTIQGDETIVTYDAMLSYDGPEGKVPATLVHCANVTPNPIP